MPAVFNRRQASSDGRPPQSVSEAARAVRQIQPRAFVFENVKGLTRESFAKYFAYIVLQLTYPTVIKRAAEEWTQHLSRLERMKTNGMETDLRYTVVWRLLNAADYGVPQRRERVFIVGFRSDIQIPWAFPSATHSREALLTEQWGTGDYWERHRIAQRNRPGAPNHLGRIANDPLLFREPVGRLAWRTVRDAIADLGEPARTVGSLKYSEPRLAARCALVRGPHWKSPRRTCQDVEGRRSRCAWR